MALYLPEVASAASFYGMTLTLLRAKADDDVLGTFDAKAEDLLFL